MRNTTIVIAFLCISFLSWTQDDGNPVIINFNVNRPVEPAYRIASSPIIIDTVMKTSIITYPLLSLQQPTTVQLENIEAAQVKLEPKLPQLYHSYVKLGIGSKPMPLGEFYFDGTRSRKYNYGAHLKHLSSFGNISAYAPAQFDRNDARLFGSINENKYTLSGDLHYNNKGFHYYGFQNDSIDRDSIAQRFSDVGGTFSYASHQKDSAQLNYKIGVNYNNFLSKKPLVDSLSHWRAMENYVVLNANATYRLGKEIYAADFNVKYNGYKYGVKDSSISLLDSGIVLNNTVINLAPSISTFAKNNRLKAKIGVNLTLDAHTATKFYIYPDAEIKYSLFNDLFIPFAGITGGLQQNTFRSLTQQNEFLLTNVNMKNENKALDLFVGIKGTLARRVSFNVNAHFAHVSNKALFITDTTFSVGNKFDLVFDTMNITTVEGSLSYQLLEKIKVDAIGRYFSYSLNNNSYAWNLPQWQIIARGSYNLYDKFFANLDLNFEGGRKTLVYKVEEGVTEENLQLAKNLGLVADLNLGLEYRYNKRLSAFLQFNNFASQRYKRWYNVPVQGFQVMGGVTFRF